MYYDKAPLNLMANAITGNIIARNSHHYKNFKVLNFHVTQYNYFQSLDYLCKNYKRVTVRKSYARSAVQYPRLTQVNSAIKGSI